jgi:uncharacterized protein
MKHLKYAMAFLLGKKAPHYRMREEESVFIVNLNGDVYGVARPYEEDYRYGNVFHEPFEAVLTSSGRERAIQETTERTSRFCGGCEFSGHCPTFFVAAASPQQEAMLIRSGCPVRAVLRHMVGRLRETRSAGAGQRMG